jgi:hypothetical protein
MPLYLVETVSIFRHRYVVDCKEPEHATDTVIMGLGDENFKEFSQYHVDECVSSVREIDQDQYLKQLVEDNEYLESWSQEQKLKLINKVNYDES